MTAVGDIVRFNGRYTYCPGAGKPGIGAHQANTAGLGSKFSHMHGKTYATCPECGRRGLIVPRADARPVVRYKIPRHKPAGTDQP